MVKNLWGLWCYPNNITTPHPPLVQLALTPLGRHFSANNDSDVLQHFIKLSFSVGIIYKWASIRCNQFKLQTFGRFGSTSLTLPTDHQMQWFRLLVLNKICARRKVWKCQQLIKKFSASHNLVKLVLDDTYLTVGTHQADQQQHVCPCNLLLSPT